MRSTSRHVVVLGAALISAFTFRDIRAYGQASNDFPNPYKIENFGQLPGGRKIGQIYGIDIDRDGKSVWVFERCGAATCDGSNLPPLLKFDSAGRLVASFGAGMFVYPHGLFVDGDDNIWVTDGQAKNGKDEDLKAFAAKTVPVVRDHLKSAQALAGSLQGGNSGGAKGEGKDRSPERE